MATKDLFNYDKEIRTGDDYRLPDSLMSVEEFREAVRLMDLIRQEPAGNYDMDDKRSRFFDLYRLLLKCYEKHQDDPEKAERCVICGAPSCREKKDGSQSPFCAKCHTRLNDLQFPNTQNTRGLRNWGRFCVVCHRNPVHPDHNGLCKNCYKLVDNMQRNWLWNNRSELLPEDLLAMDQKDPEIVSKEKKYLNEHARELLPPELNVDPRDPEVIRRFRIDGFSQQLILGEKATPMDLRDLLRKDADHEE